MVKTLRKGAIVKYVGDDKKFVETWGNFFEVQQKEGNFLRLVSLKEPCFGICASVSCKNCELAK